MRFTFDCTDVREVFAGARTDIERAVTAAMRDAGRDLTAALRADVVGAGLGERLARTWRGRTYPEHGTSLEAAAFVWSKASKLVDAFDRGVTIRSRDGFWLAIPTPAAGARGIGSGGRRVRITPGGWERRTGMRLRFVYRRRGPSLLVADNARLNKRGLAAPNRRKSGQATVVVFLLVPQVRLRKRLNVEAIAGQQAERVPDLIARHLPTS